MMLLRFITLLLMLSLAMPVRAASPIEEAFGAGAAKDEVFADLTPLVEKVRLRGPNSVSTPIPGTTFISICYHNVEDDDPDQTFMGVSTARMVAQINWFKQNGYHPVSLDEILAAKNGGKPLPDKALLLTFDDGYTSFYTHVYPVLKAHEFPSVFAVVGAWLEKGHPDDLVDYGDKQLPRSAFVTTAQLREMADSGLVEIASHSNNLHRGILANPQGNVQPAAITREYNPKTGTYESDTAYMKRIDDDAKAISKKIKQYTGKKPRAMVWPYGAYNQMAADIYARNGMDIAMTLEDGYATAHNLTAIPRYLVSANPDMGEFARDVNDSQRINHTRIVQVDLDYVYDPDQTQMAKNIDQLIARIYNMKISAVYLQAFADPTGSGLAKELYFPNRHLPVRHDLFNRVAWQLATRADVKVYAWMPVLAYDFGDDVETVTAWDPKTETSAPDEKAYRRLSPFDPEARRKIIDLYEDLARSSPINGILFHDDALLSDFEDASAPALAAYSAAGFPASIQIIRANPQTMQDWTRFKTDTLISFTQELAAHARIYRSPVATVRNIYAPLMTTPNSEEWFAQDYDRFLASYDYTAIMAMPYMENVDEDDADEWFTKMVEKVAARPEGLRRTVFELQAVDWRKTQEGEDRAIPTSTLGKHIRLLQRKGALNIGYYPDDFVQNHPNATELHKDFSLQSYRYNP